MLRAAETLAKMPGRASGAGFGAEFPSGVPFWRQPSITADPAARSRALVALATSLRPLPPAHPSVPLADPLPVSATLAANETMEERRRRGEPVLPMAFGEAGLPVHPLLRE